uniref:BRO1 domain-containing protein BROX n=1 Tax=Laticauda laticaudata TaxID=8630 RepID=A0A8C5SI96_LATLA
MTHWFHRNPLKATAPVSFNYYGVATTPAATKICNDLRLSRARLLELFTDLSCNPEMMKNATDSYFSLLEGFIPALDNSSQDSKLRYIQNFKWTDTLQGQIPSAQQDAVFELVSMGFNVALWYTKYASRLAGKEDITEDEAKDVHRSMKIAAGIFRHLKESHIPKLITPVEKGRDLEGRLIDSYIIQCQAEAQEVTIARAIELKHNPGLIAALAYETANFYQKADQTLSSLDPAYTMKWRKYLQLKSCFYMAYVSIQGFKNNFQRAMKLLYKIAICVFQAILVNLLEFICVLKAHNPLSQSLEEKPGLQNSFKRQRDPKCSYHQEAAIPKARSWDRKDMHPGTYQMLHFRGTAWSFHLRLILLDKQQKTSGFEFAHTSFSWA